MKFSDVKIIASNEASEQRMVRDIRRVLGKRRIVKIDIDHLASLGPIRRRAELDGANTLVFVISAATLASAPRRLALVSGNPFLDQKEVRAYFIWMMKKPMEAVRRYPDLAPLADALPLPLSRRDVMADLTAYAQAHTGTSLKRYLRPLPRLITELVLTRLGSLLIYTRLLQVISILAALLLTALLLFGAGRSWRSVLALLSLYSVGFVVGGIETFDLWPWRYGGASKEAALRALRIIRRQTILTQSGVFALFVVPCVVAMRLDRIPPAWIIGAAAIGIVIEIVLTNLYRFTWPRHFEAQGVGSRVLLNQRAVALRPRFKGKSIVRPVRRMKRDEADYDRVYGWANDVELGARAFVRPWLRQRDFVFISYAWDDDPQRSAVTAVSDALARAGIPHFLDRRALGDDYQQWRPQVAAALGRATHVLLVASPRLDRAKTVEREAKTIIARWHVEALPAVLCVGDAELGARLACSGSVPLELRFMLAWCTWLTHEQALDSALLRTRIAEHRRQGRLRDWWTLFAGVRPLTSP